MEHKRTTTIVQLKLDQTMKGLSGTLEQYTLADIKAHHISRGSIYIFGFYNLETQNLIGSFFIFLQIILIFVLLNVVGQILV